MDNTNTKPDKQTCKFEHQFRPVEKVAAEERVALHIEEVKNAQQQDQYSFDKSIPNVLSGFDSSPQYTNVPYSINREYIQLRPGMIYNTVRENCKKKLHSKIFPRRTPFITYLYANISNWRCLHHQTSMV